jgi:3-dehydroquinate synthase
MLEELQPNLWEAELERCVDFGHSFSPTIEMRALPSLLHGEAVSLDMALTTAISLRRGYLADDEATRIYRTMADLGLPLWDPILESRGLLLQALADTIRHRDGKQRIPLVTGIGRYEFANDITDEEIRSAIHWLAGAGLEYSKPGAEQIVR